MEWKHPEEEEADAFLDEAAKQKPKLQAAASLSLFFNKKN
jgi:hypothetical protein